MSELVIGMMSVILLVGGGLFYVGYQEANDKKNKKK
jgi:glucose uptake protein GlcU